MYKNVCAKLHLQLVYMNTIMSSFVLTILSNAIYDLIEIKTCEMINVSQTSFILLSASSIRYLMLILLTLRISITKEVDALQKVTAHLN